MFRTYAAPILLALLLFSNYVWYSENRHLREKYVSAIQDATIYQKLAAEAAGESPDVSDLRALLDDRHVKGLPCTDSVAEWKWQVANGNPTIKLDHCDIAAAH